ncbi:MAG: hypothetical protein EXS27_00115 [Pedosphaera sp.]|nr:hypothetical protein [Pedosphaera sp.]
MKSWGKQSFRSCLAVVGFWTTLTAHAAIQTPADEQTTAFIKEHCLPCHGAEKTKGDLRLDQLDTDFFKPSTFERWREVVVRVQSGEMVFLKLSARGCGADVR